MNYDGFGEALVGSPGWDGGTTDEGKAWVFYGGATGPATAPNWTAEGDQFMANYGWVVDTAGDVNGDGLHDLVVSAYLYDGGQFDGDSTSAYAITKGNEASSSGYEVAPRASVVPTSGFASGACEASALAVSTSLTLLRT